MSDLDAWISSLTPTQRTLFQLRLQKKNAPSAKLQAIARRRESGPCPLTFEQERLWFVQQLFPEGAAYNISNEYRSFGRLDIPALLRSLQEIVRRHEILRTSFVAMDGQPWQVVLPPEVPDLPLVDLSGLPEARRESELRRSLGDRARQPFDLAAEKPLRVTLFRRGDADHLLFPTIHHVATDWWSFTIFQNELAALYRDLSRGRPPSLPDPPIQFADFALWQREWLRDEVLERLLAYWREQLAGAPPLLDLPTDRPRPETARFVGARQLLPVRPATMDRLRSLSQQNEVTPFVTFLSAYAALLFRGSQVGDFLIGTPVADRGRPETEHLIGYFLNLLVLRMGITGEITFQQLMRRVRETVYGAYAHQDLPYGKLLDDLRPARTLNHMPLAQISYVYVMAPGAGASPAAAKAEPAEAPFDPGTSRFDLTFVVEDMPQGLLSFLEYSSDLFDATTMLRMALRLQSLLEQVASDPDLRICDLALLSPPERAALLCEWNDTAGPLPDLCLSELIAEQVRRAPDSLAVRSRGYRLTYRELGRSAGLLASRLQRLGVGPDVRVGVALERSAWLVIGLLGVLEAGGAYVPLDPAYPRERLSLMMSDARIRVLITDSSLADGLLAGLPGRPEDVVCLDAEWREIEAAPPAPPAGVLPESLVYVLYTSGSTGRPKGVAVPHRALINLLLAMREILGFTATDGLLALTSLSFDIAALEIFLPLITGGHIDLASQEEALDGSLLADRLAEPSVTVLQATPATWRMLVDAKWPGRRDLVALCGGEPMPRPLAEALQERTGTLWNLYGPTETTVWSTAARIEWGDRPLVSIGRPVANTRVRILDRDLRPVPRGTPGELSLGGSGLARGYLDRPDLTAERFLPDPLADAEPGARLYRTGDLGRHLADGRLELLGRVDQQVKVRGFRIEPGEVEAALEVHPAVAQAVVVAWGEGPARRLVAYLVPGGEGEPRADELRRFLADRLPGQMVPALYIPLPALPLTPSGKIDRSALPQPQAERPELQEGYVVPRNELEQAIAASWQEVLGLDRVGVHDNFFDLGGNSLLLFQVRHRQQERLGLDLPLNLFFRYPSVASLAEHLSGLARPDTAHEGQARGEARRAAEDVQTRLRERRQGARRQG